MCVCTVLSILHVCYHLLFTTPLGSWCYSHCTNTENLARNLICSRSNGWQLAELGLNPDIGSRAAQLTLGWPSLRAKSLICAASSSWPTFLFHPLSQVLLTGIGGTHAEVLSGQMRAGRGGGGAPTAGAAAPEGIAPAAPRPHRGRSAVGAGCARSHSRGSCEIWR